MEKKPDQLEYVKSIGYDSIEEWEFGQWCEEAREIGLLSDFVHHPPAIKLSDKVTYKATKQLKTKTKEVEVFLMHPHEYTCDYTVDIDLGLWARAGINPDPKFMSASDNRFWVDVKGGFSPYHDAKQFSINRKWVWDKHRIYINEVVPEEWFKRTFTPQSALVTWKTGKMRDKYRGCLTKDIIRARVVC